MHTFAVALAGAMLVAASAGAQPRQDFPTTAAPLNVPYISQGDLLCGGAAAAMLLRYWGARGVYAEDFAPLVDRRAGGITTETLARAVRDRGWRATLLPGRDDGVREALYRGEPVIALIQVRAERYHYVVIVGWEHGNVVYHDPARGPLQSVRATEFDRAWQAANRWAMAVLPGSKVSTGIPASTGTTGSGSDEAAPDSGDDAVMTAFERQDYRESARLARDRVQRDPADAEGWRILGASLYLESRKTEALDAWNHVGEPRVDIVTFAGLVHTPYRAAGKLADISPRTILTATELRRADRRLALLPSAESTSVTYTALPGGLAEVTGAVVEEPRSPRLIEWLVQGVKLPFTEQLSASFANVLGRGGDWNAMWRFEKDRPAVHLGVDMPAGSMPGVWSIDAGWETNTFQIGAGAAASTTRRGGRLGWTDWIASDTRMSIGAGVARWNDRSTRVMIDASVQQRAWADHVAFGVGVSGAPGSAPFATTVAHLAWRTAGKPLRLVGSVVASRASDRAPIDLWPFAGAGSGRELLLRGHDLRENGILRTDVYGRSVNVGTLEVQRDVYARGPATLAIAGFADIGRIRERVDGSASPLQVDAGVGLRIRPGIGDRAIRVDLARAMRDGGVLLSAGYQVSWFDRKVRQ